MKREIIECDRCGEDAGQDREKAGRAYAATLSGADRVGSSVTPADLCGSCMTDLVDFMGGRSLERPETAKAARRKETVS